MFKSFQIFDFKSQTTPGEVLKFRVFEAYIAYAITSTVLNWADYIQHVEAVVHPLGLAHHLPLGWMLNPWVPWVNAVAIGLFSVAGLLGLFRWGYACAFGLMLFQYAARYCLGEIPHSANLIGMALLGFSIANVAFRGAHNIRRFALGFTFFSIGTCYFSAALCKLAVAGLDWPLGEHLSLWVYNKETDAFSKSGEWGLNLVQQFIVDHRWAGTLFLTTGLVSELGSVLVFHPKFRLYALWAIIGLHLGILASMEIFFQTATISLVILALPLGLFERIMRHPLLREQHSSRWLAGTPEVG